LAVATYPALLASQFPIVVVGAVDTSGIYAPYSQGLAAELTVSAVERVVCASRQGGTSEAQGTSYGEPLSMQMPSKSDDIRHGDLAAPAVAGLAAYHVAGSVQSATFSPRICCDEQPVTIWNGIDSRQIYITKWPLGGFQLQPSTLDHHDEDYYGDFQLRFSIFQHRDGLVHYF